MKPLLLLMAFLTPLFVSGQWDSAQRSSTLSGFQKLFVYSSKEPQPVFSAGGFWAADGKGNPQRVISGNAYLLTKNRLNLRPAVWVGVTTGGVCFIQFPIQLTVDFKLFNFSYGLNTGGAYNAATGRAGPTIGLDFALGGMQRREKLTFELREGNFSMFDNNPGDFSLYLLFSAGYIFDAHPLVISKQDLYNREERWNSSRLCIEASATRDFSQGLSSIRDQAIGFDALLSWKKKNSYYLQPALELGSLDNRLFFRVPYRAVIQGHQWACRFGPDAGFYLQNGKYSYLGIGGQASVGWMPHNLEFQLKCGSATLIYIYNKRLGGQAYNPNPLLGVFYAGVGIGFFPFE